MKKMLIVMTLAIALVGSGVGYAAADTGTGTGTSDNGQTATTSSIFDQAAKVQKVLALMQQLWQKQTMLDLLAGKVALTDEVTNELLNDTIQYFPDKDIKAVQIETHPDNKLYFRGKAEGYDDILIKTTLRQFIHNSKSSYIDLHVDDTSFSDGSVGSYFKNLYIRRYSFATLYTIFGGIDFNNNAMLTADGDDIKLDFTQAIINSPLGQNELYGEKISDMIVIKSATTGEGMLYLNVDFNIPQQLKDYLLSIVSVYNSAG